MTVLDIVKRALTGADADVKEAAVLDLAAHVTKSPTEAHEVAAELTKALSGKDAAQKEAALIAIKSIVSAKTVPFFLHYLAAVLELVADNKLSALAREASNQIVKSADPLAVKLILPQIAASLTIKSKWQTKVAALQCLKDMTTTSTTQVGLSLTEIIPLLTETCADVRAEVVKAAEDALLAAAMCTGNKDIEPFVPALCSSMARPAEITETVEKLAATTFVQAVEPPALALMVPVLSRGLLERHTATKRKSSVIIDNMCKLVTEPRFARTFLPKLGPGLERVKEETSDPECRQVATRAYKTMMNAAGGEEAAAAAAAAAAATPAKGKGGKGAAKKDESTETLNSDVNLKMDPGSALETLKECLAAAAPSAKLDAPAVGEVLGYVAGLASSLVDQNDFELAAWEGVLSKHLAGASHLVPADAVKAAAKAMKDKCYKEAKGPDAVEEEEEGEDLCNCEFSLAYGGKILLNTARLHLKRGKRYALIGPNGVGKSTLMRAISNGQLEGFPPPDQLRTVYVEHDIQSELADLTVVEYIFADPALAGSDKAEVVKTLASVGFTDAMQAGRVTALSGGWKMKLALARAMLLRADILLLDEPTNHLDKVNVAWLTNYLCNLPTCTSMVVSHDSKFLDDVCTDVIHYESFKLKRYKGNLSQFVKRKPEAAAYYDIKMTQQQWRFPEPGFLEGVKSKDKAILKMMHTGFTYPGTTRKVVYDASIFCSLSSRVAVVGANGAGKSTMIKMLIGELIPTEGTVWKHPNLRIAYVAQHAFHHLEKHLDDTPSEYIQWRFATGEDRENLDLANRQLTAEEEKKQEQKHEINGVKMVVKEVLARRKLRNSYEYEVSWVGMGPDKNMWLPRKDLEGMGFGKNCDALDAREAAQAGLALKPLTAANIAKHLENLGLEQEFTLHSRIRGLSGGQKVKVVLGAATWQNPHVLVLDEPTNYLDRDSLGALTGALIEFGGGVIIISHQFEFTNAICREKWLLEGGRLTIEGGGYAVATKIDAPIGDEEVVDAAGNVTVVQRKKELTGRDLRKAEKAKAKDRKTRAKRGEEVTDDEEE